MKIEGPGSVPKNPVRRSGRTGSGSASAFARALTAGEEDGTAAAIGGTAAANAVNPLFAIQEVEDATTGRKKARKRGTDILDELDRIRIALLSGTLGPDQLQALARLISSKRSAVDDPDLAAVLDEVDLRAQVELAKLMPGR